MLKDHNPARVYQPRQTKLGTFLAPTPRQRFKRAIRELDEARARDTAWDIIGLAAAVAVCLVLVVALC